MGTNGARLAGLALAAAALMATGCGSGAASGQTAATHAPGPSPGAAANALVCRHYLKQRSWAKHLAMPTLADAAKLVQYVAADDASAVPGTKLRRDLDAMVADYSAHRAVYAASKRVYYDCAK